MIKSASVDSGNSRRKKKMKTIGMLGGMSWESSIEYYRIINQTVRSKLGGLHSAKTLMYSLDFAEIEFLQHHNRWDEACEMLVAASQQLQNGGADFIIICTNTMHKLADELQQNIDIPLVHIADATAEAIKKAGLKKVGLLGTRFTMEEDFYKGRLEERHRLTVLIPGENDRELVHRVIYDELCLGEINSSSKQKYREIIASLVQDGAQGIILGCTEISLLVDQTDSPVELFDTTLIHARTAVEYALAS
jgi:aspartate racemase